MNESGNIKQTFDIDEIYSDINSTFPNTTPRPIVGITGNLDAETCKLAFAYYKSVELAGGVPVIIPPSRSKQTILNVLGRIDALVLSGGADINPLFMDEAPVQGLHGINPERDDYELLLTRLAFDRQIPILGICRGIQTLTLALGGSMFQVIYSTPDRKRLLKHSQDAPRNTLTHFVNIEKSSLLAQICKAEKIAVNSFHHQAISSPGEHLKISAYATDGVIEAVESSEFKPVLGVQWHPECLTGDNNEAAGNLFDWIVAEGETYRKARKFHASHLTLDTHCDTPMFFPKGIDIRKRDPKILVDLHKMDEGGLDASIMAAYIPQGPRDDASLAAATRMADDIFGKIDEMTGKADGVELARTPADLMRLKSEGKHAIMKAIENGYALAKDITNVERYACEGVVYITLCHNGDNDICDSAAKTRNEHGGVSDFGEKVIKEMNRCGIMVDLSHGGEKSFYDAMEISSLPIVCSHASSRALCDHPRNLTDDQLRALRKTGGVAQVTFYEGFLRRDGKATVLDAMDHLEHIIEIAGIEHAGIGSDFDGDGGVPGIASAAEMINITKRLLRKRYSEKDIALIWGGNFLRVMQQVQDAAEI